MDTLHNACTELDMETEDFAVEYIRGDKVRYLLLFVFTQCRGMEL